jgi:hypothetical protein
MKSGLDADGLIFLDSIKIGVAIDLFIVSFVQINMMNGEFVGSSFFNSLDNESRIKLLGQS